MVFWVSWLVFGIVLVTLWLLDPALRRPQECLGDVLGIPVRRNSCREQKVFVTQKMNQIHCSAVVWWPRKYREKCLHTMCSMLSALEDLENMQRKTYMEFGRWRLDIALPKCSWVSTRRCVWQLCLEELAGLGITQESQWTEPMGHASIRVDNKYSRKLSCSNMPMWSAVLVVELCIEACLTKGVTAKACAENVPTRTPRSARGFQGFSHLKWPLNPPRQIDHFLEPPLWTSLQKSTLNIWSLALGCGPVISTWIWFGEHGVWDCSTTGITWLGSKCKFRDT